MSTCLPYTLSIKEIIPLLYRVYVIYANSSCLVAWFEIAEVSLDAENLMKEALGSPIKSWAIFLEPDRLGFWLVEIIS